MEVPQLLPREAEPFLLISLCELKSLFEFETLIESHSTFLSGLHIPSQVLSETSPIQSCKGCTSHRLFHSCSRQSPEVKPASGLGGSLLSDVCLYSCPRTCTTIEQRTLLLLLTTSKVMGLREEDEECIMSVRVATIIEVHTCL